MNESSDQTAAVNPFLDISWSGLEEWAGTRIVSRGKSYQRSGEVENLGITP